MSKNGKTWRQYHSDMNELVNKLGNYNPDIIVPCMLGGLFPASIIAKRTMKRINSHNQPFDMRPINILRRGTERWLSYGIQGDINGKDILIVEDDAFTGLGFKFVRTLFEEQGAIVKTAAVYITPECQDMVDFFVEIHASIPNYPWKKAYGGDRY